MRRTLLAITTTLVTLAFAASSALASTTFVDSVTGVEVQATNTRGVFVGVATGDLPGVWKAVVDHTPLGGSVQTAQIIGGTFTLWTGAEDDLVTVSGAFTSGTVTQTGGFVGCVNETYAVVGSLVIGSASEDTGSFDAILTHYRKPIPRIGCVTYAASVAGTVTLNLAQAP